MTKKELMQAVGKEYQQGTKIIDIAKQFNISRATVTNYINSLGIIKRKLVVDETVIATMVTMYKQGYSQIDIAKAINSQTKVVHKYLKQELGELRSAALQRQKVKHNPFSDLENQNVQYWLGYICADGNIRNKKNTIRIITCSDPEHLESTYMNFLNVKLKVLKSIDNRFEPAITNTTVSFDSKEVKDFLISLGITPNKTFTLKVNFPLTFHFLRGFFDGDGTVSSRNISITCASKDFVEQITCFLDLHNINYYISVVKNKYYQVGITKRKGNLIKFYKKLYENAETYLERKRLAFSIDDDIV